MIDYLYRETLSKWYRILGLTQVPRVYILLAIQRTCRSVEVFVRINCRFSLLCCRQVELFAAFKSCWKLLDGNEMNPRGGKCCAFSPEFSAGDERHVFTPHTEHTILSLGRFKPPEIIFGSLGWTEMLDRSFGTMSREPRWWRTLVGCRFWSVRSSLLFIKGRL